MKLFTKNGVSVFGGGSTHKADIDAVDIVLDLHDKWHPWGLPNHWKSGQLNKPQIISMYISDMQAPYWVGRQFWSALWGDLETEAKGRGGKLSVLVACFGGHGRTGTVLTALALAAGVVPKKADPIAWMRDHYCEHAIESMSQVQYLETTFKFHTSETPYKGYTSTVTPNSSSYTPSSYFKGKAAGKDLVDMWDHLS